MKKIFIYKSSVRTLLSLICILTLWFIFEQRAFLQSKLTLLPVKRLQAQARSASQNQKSLQPQDKAIKKENFIAPLSSKTIEVAAQEVMVKFRVNMSEAEITAKIQQMGAEVIDKVEKLGLYRLRIPNNTSTSDFVQASRAEMEVKQDNAEITLIEPNHLAKTMAAEIVPNDPLYPNQWALRQIGAPTAWETTTGNPNVIVAVLDTGIDSTHPDLHDQVISGKNLIQNNDLTMDDNGHGTAMAGVIGAIGNNGKGIAGVCWGCRLMPVKVLDNQGTGTYADVIKGILYAVDNGARVLNLSLGGEEYSQALADAVAYAHSAGVIIVAAGGNDGTKTPVYPAAYSDVIGVGATDINNHIWPLSNRGEHIKLTAPGVGIMTTGLQGQYSQFNGTSLSAAITSGTVALMLSSTNNKSNNLVAQALYLSARRCCTNQKG